MAYGPAEVSYSSIRYLPRIKSLSVIEFSMRLHVQVGVVAPTRYLFIPTRRMDARTVTGINAHG
jgi:hypothetical protein